MAAARVNIANTSCVKASAGFCPRAVTESLPRAMPDAQAMEKAATAAASPAPRRLVLRCHAWVGPVAGSRWRRSKTGAHLSRAYSTNAAPRRCVVERVRVGQGDLLSYRFVNYPLVVSVALVLAGEPRGSREDGGCRTRRP